VGYLAVGVLAGPYGLGLLKDVAEIRLLAELGVMFLMFVLGLEFSLPVMWSARRAVFGVGGVQVLVTAGLAGAAAHLAGASPAAALAVGGAVAMSSTAIVLKQLSEQGEISTRHGRLTVAVLLFQDLATLPFLVALPVLGAGTDDPLRAVGLALVTATAVFVAMLVAGRVLARPLMHWVARARSADFFVLSVLLLILAAGEVAHLAGLSLALGAFLAGMVVGETEFRHQVEAEVRPFQDVLLGLFFATMGMQLDPASLAGQWDRVLLILGGILVGKPVVVALAGLLLRSNPGVVLRAGLCLGQVGEFGLLIAALAINLKVLPADLGQPLFTAMVLSMAAAPVVVRWNGLLAEGLNLFGYRDNLERREDRVARAAEGLEDHVILCGYGRFGQYLARFLALEGVPYVALDLDAEHVRRARAQEEPVLYGDAGRRALLQAAGLARARARVISFNDTDMAIKVLDQVRRVRADLPVLVRATDQRDLPRLTNAGATEVMPEALEASIAMGAQLLLLMGLPQSRVEEHRDTVRADQYRLLRGAAALPAGTELAKGETVITLRLERNTCAVDRPLEEVNPQRFGVRVLALRRSGLNVPRPSLDTPLRVGDVLLLAGTPGALERAATELSARRPRAPA
jgi:CPA2 family monovalent cation:H+ antiporter-2